MSKQKTRDCGEIVSALVKEGILTKEKVDYALRVQQKISSPKTLLQIMEELGYIDEEQIKQTLRKNKFSMRIGDLLVELGLLTEDKLHAAIEIQKETEGKKIGEILVEHKFIAESDFLGMLSAHMGYPLVKPELMDIPMELFRKVGSKWYKDYKVIPVSMKDGKVVLACADPLDIDTITQAKRRFGKDSIIAVASAEQILKTIEKLEKMRKSSKVEVFDESSATGVINTIISSAITEDASDIHIEPMEDKLRIRFRIDGILIHFKDYPKDIIPMVTSRLKILSNANITERRRHQDGRLSFEHNGDSFDLRVSFYVTIHGDKVVMRILTKMNRLISLEDIGMQPRMLKRFINDVVDSPSGVMIVTGPTGSGKTTTLYSCINYLNSPQISILTAEEPVEYVMDGIAQCSINPAINLTFQETLRHVVRQDPDVIVIGEVRDKYSADIAVQSALTGHKVLTSFHTEDSVSGLIRLVNMDIEAFLVSSTIVCVIAQRLIRKVCPECGKPYTPSAEILKRLGYSPADIRGFTFRKGEGCANCRYTGYRGRVAVFEMLVLNEFVREAILKHRTSYEIRKISVESSGLVTLMEDAFFKAAMGITTVEEVIRCIPKLMAPRSLSEIKRLLGA